MAANEAIGEEAARYFRLITGEGLALREVAFILDRKRSQYAVQQLRDRWIKWLGIVAKRYGF